jgi:simple sugar transport system permease protein
VGLGLAALIIGLELAGFHAGVSLGALWSGSFGSWDAFTSATLVRAVPLILIGLGIAVAFRGGALNIGAEGQFYAGAIAATWVGLRLGSAPGGAAIAILIIAAIVAGLLWIIIPVWLKLRFGVLEVISTLLLNFIALSLVSLMVQGPLQEPERIYPQSETISEAARLPLLLAGSRLHAGLVLALLSAVILWYVFARTLWGFRLRAVGLGPRAAEVTGRIDSQRMGAVAMLISGGIAGLAGGVEVSGVSYALFQNLSPGYGFTGIAVALLGGLHPVGVVVAGILFGALQAGAGAMQREAGVPAVTVNVVEAIIIIVALLATAPPGGWIRLRGMVRRRIAPRAA